MKRILINATHNEEIRVALCQGKHMYDFDLENRTREQKKSNIYKAHVTRVEPSLEAVFVEYGAKRQGFLPVREIAKQYLSGNPRNEDIRNLIKEGDTLIVQVEKEERGNKGAALSTYISLAGRYLVLMPNNPRGGGISRQISGKMRENMKRIVSSLELSSDMSVIIRTAGIGKELEDLQHDLNHLLNIWQAVSDQDKKYDSPRLVHQEAGVVTRALRDYLTDDISEIWVDSEDAYNEATYFIQSVMPKQSHKLLKYTDIDPMFARFGIEKQIETAYQREVRLPSGGSIVIDQTEAMVAIDINSAKSNKGADIAETAYNTNLEAAEEVARQLRLRDMGGLVVIDFIDMSSSQHQKDVERRLIDSTKYDRARIQFTEISKFGLMEMSRQRLRPSLEESTGYKCPRCHGTGMIRDLRSLGLSIMRQIEKMALARGTGELQAQVPNDIAAFLLNEKRDALVYLEQDSGTRITILPHAHMESPDYEIHYNPEGFAPASYERITDNELEQSSEIGYDVDWQTADNKRPKQQPVRQLKENTTAHNSANTPQKQHSNSNNRQVTEQTPQPQAVAWLSNLFAPAPQASVEAITTQDATQAIESLVNSGHESLGSRGQIDPRALIVNKPSLDVQDTQEDKSSNRPDKSKRVPNRKPKHDKARYNKDRKKHNKPHAKASEKGNDEQNYTHDKKIENEKTVAVEQTTHEKNTADSPKVNKDAKNTHSNQTHNNQQSNKNKAHKGSQSDNKDVKPVKNNTDTAKNKKSVQKETQEKAQKSSQQARSSERATSKKESVQHLSLDTSKPIEPALQVQMAQHKKAQELKVATSEKQESQAQEQKPQKVKKAPRKDGRAFNDPRVVRAELSAKSNKKQQPSTPSKPIEITGNVGQFLRLNLDNADQRLQQEGVIACFIDAINRMKSDQIASSADAQVHTELDNDFDFSNYGYDVLSNEYLANFNAMVTSADIFNAQQGKTVVEPSVIGKRADNDPRGQSAEYLAEQEAKIQAEQEALATNADEVAPQSEAVEDSEATIQTGLFATEVHDIATDLVIEESEQPEHSVDDSVQAGSDNQQSDDSSNEHAYNSDDSALIPELQSEIVGIDEQDVGIDEQGERSKTTFDKYKSMLANVSEQLSTTPSNNINSLFLSTPRVPKTRTRKK